MVSHTETFSFFVIFLILKSFIKSNVYDIFFQLKICWKKNFRKVTLMIVKLGFWTMGEEIFLVKKSHKT